MNREKRNPNLTSASQKLRHNMTKEERHLWYDFLKCLELKVYRQHVIGGYIADFYIASKNIVIELDGSEHYSPEQQSYDKKRNEYMSSRGLTVLRYSNLEIARNFNGVCEDIMRNAGLI